MCESVVMRWLPWLYWPFIVVLTIAGLASLAEESRTVATVAMFWILAGTFLMMQNADDRRR